MTHRLRLLSEACLIRARNKSSAGPKARYSKAYCSLTLLLAIDELEIDNCCACVAPYLTIVLNAQGARKVELTENCNLSCNSNLCIFGHVCKKMKCSLGISNATELLSQGIDDNGTIAVHWFEYVFV